MRLLRDLLEWILISYKLFSLTLSSIMLTKSRGLLLIILQLFKWNYWLAAEKVLCVVMYVGILQICSSFVHVAKLFFIEMLNGRHYVHIDESVFAETGVPMFVNWILNPKNNPTKYCISQNVKSVGQDCKIN